MYQSGRYRFASYLGAIAHAIACNLRTVYLVDLTGTTGRTVWTSGPLPDAGRKAAYTQYLLNGCRNPTWASIRF